MSFEGDHPIRGLGEHLAIVADVEHGLARGAQRFLELPLGGDVEVVVGFVEQEHLLIAAEQHLEREPLLLPTAQRCYEPVPHRLEGLADAALAAHVPGDLGFVAAG